jgi:peptide deformylase
VTTYPIRVFGDPVLRQVAKPVEEFDGRLARLVETMTETMYEAPGVGLAAPQVGVQKRLFVYDIGEGAQTVVNPEIVEASGEWEYDEGCLSVPGLSFEIVRPNQITLRGFDVDGNPVEFEVEEFHGRVFQHEMDHLNGLLVLDHLEPKVRRDAMRQLREMAIVGGPVKSDHRL